MGIWVWWCIKPQPRTNRSTTLPASALLWVNSSQPHADGTVGGLILFLVFYPRPSNKQNNQRKAKERREEGDVVSIRVMLSLPLRVGWLAIGPVRPPWLEDDQQGYSMLRLVHAEKSTVVHNKWYWAPVEDIENRGGWFQSGLGTLKMWRVA